MFNKNVLSIDIGSKDIKIVVGHLKSNNIYVDKAITIATPRDSYKNGYILESEVLREAIYDILTKEGIKEKKAICTVKSTAIITREVILPFVAKAEDIGPMVRNEIEQFLPIMLDDYVIEFRVLQEFMDGEIKKMRVVVAALPKEIAKDYFELLQGLDLTPIALDMNANTILKLFSNSFQINDENYSLDKTVSIVDLGHNYIDINIVSRGIMEFSRVIPMGSSDIDMSIANTLNLSIDEAEFKKINEIDIMKEGLANSFSEEMLKDTIKSNIEYWVQEIKRVYQYYLNRSRENSVEEVYLYGGASKLKGLTEYANSILEVPCASINKMSNVKLSKDLLDTDIRSYLNCIGAIIRK